MLIGTNVGPRACNVHVMQQLQLDFVPYSRYISQQNFHQCTSGGSSSASNSVTWHDVMGLRCSHPCGTVLNILFGQKYQQWNLKVSTPLLRGPDSQPMEWLAEVCQTANVDTDNSIVCTASKHMGGYYYTTTVQLEYRECHFSLIH